MDELAGESNYRGLVDLLASKERLATSPESIGCARVCGWVRAQQDVASPGWSSCREGTALQY